MFFDIPLGELFNHSVPLKDLLDDVVGELETGLVKAQ